ncbi:lysine 2,3-aminomutase [Nocardiopsis sp. NPDC006198]|uniref:KamA family radical SAM protein n=1 Tax=Nocardiopsis sp. NPDC006198 TaxID=3154472 RepID=UPI0033A5F285
MSASDYRYQQRPVVDPDWRRFPAWRHVTEAEWRDVKWQRRNCVKSPADLEEVTGGRLGETFLEDLVRDQRDHATMSLLLPPHVINSFAPDDLPGADAWQVDPRRRYMLPIASDRLTGPWRSHPMAERDSLHEAEMWVVEGLTHRYPTKVLAELTSTCPQYCGHCTRMDLVGQSTPQVDKRRMIVRPGQRWQEMLSHIAEHPQVRDVVVSGGDVANVPWPRLESFVADLVRIPHVRDIRLASKAVVDMPQHWLTDKARQTMSRLAQAARERDTMLAVHTHVNHGNAMSPLAAEAVAELLSLGVRDVRNQGVLMAGVNDTTEDVLDLCYGLLDNLQVMPYYFYLCDMIPNAEHWRTTLSRAIEIQEAIMGHLPGFATPRLICDVPYAGKKWVHQVSLYDEERGISYWKTSFGPTGSDQDETEAFPYYDPVHLLPPSGQAWWRAAAAGSAHGGDRHRHHS